MTRIPSLAPLPLVLVLSAPLGAQQSVVFLARVGTDTLAVEVMSRVGSTTEATIRYRTPAIVVRRTLRAAEAERLAYVRTAVTTAADSAPRVTELTVVGDSARVHVHGASTPDVTFAMPAGAIPFLDLSGATIELILRRARALGGDSVQVPLLVTGATRSYAALVTRLGADSALVTVNGVSIRTRTDAAGRLLGAAVPAQRFDIERLPADSRAAAWSGAAPPPSYAAPAGAPYTAQDVEIAARAGRLSGTLTLPARRAGARVPAVVLVSGSGPQDRDGGAASLPSWRPFRELADTLSRRGIAVLRLDDRGVGGSAPPGLQATMENEAEDARDAVAWLRARPEVDAARIGLVGHSSGAEVAPMVAAADRRLRALVLIAAPASTGRTIVQYQIRYLFAQDTTMRAVQRDSLLRATLAQSDSVYAVPGWLHHFHGYDPLPTARHVRGATLILHGETDRQVPVDDAARLASAMRAAGNRSVTVRTFPRMNHLLVEDPSGHPLRYASLPSFGVRQDLRGALADWLACALAP